MRSVKKGTPKSSWTCVLPMYQGAMLEMWRDLDLGTCSSLIWERVTDGRRVFHHRRDVLLVLYSRAPFLMERPFLLFRRGPSTPSLCAASIPHDRSELTRWAVYQEAPQDNVWYQTFALAPRRAEVVRFLGWAHRPYRRASRNSSRHCWWSPILSATSLRHWDVSRYLTSSSG